MVKVLFDTNILIDYLNGVEQARDELALCSDRAISMITWMEVMVGATPESELATRRFLKSFVILPVDLKYCELAMRLRKESKIKLPDAIIWATAQVDGRLLVTRNSKDFGPNSSGIRVPYLL